MGAIVDNKCFGPHIEGNTFKGWYYTWNTNAPAPGVDAHQWSPNITVAADKNDVTSEAASAADFDAFDAWMSTFTPAGSDAFFTWYGNQAEGRRRDVYNCARRY